MEPPGSQSRRAQPEPGEGGREAVRCPISPPATNAPPSGHARDGGRAGDAMARSIGKVIVGSMLATAALRFRDDEALLCVGTGRRFTFGQANARCNRLAHALVGLGLRKPEVVAFLCNNRAEMLEIYFALAKSGLVGLPLNYRLAPPEIVALMRAWARGRCFRDRFAAAAAQVREALPGVGHSSRSARTRLAGRSATRAC